MKQENNWAVGMVTYLCPCCFKEEQAIIIPSKLTAKNKQQIEEAHNKCLGFGEPCEDCQKYINDGYIAFVPLNQEEYQKGFIKVDEDMLWLKKDKAQQFFNQNFNSPVVHTDVETILMFKKMREDYE